MTTISAIPEKKKKRRNPSKKERDYRKKIKLEEEKKARNERKYEKYLKYGQLQDGQRGDGYKRSFSKRGGKSGRGGVDV